jgi:hypothetical protein
MITSERTVVAEVGAAQTTAGSPLPPEVERIFRDALDRLADVDEFDTVLDRAFGSETGTVPDRTTASLIRTQLRSRSASQAAGVAVLLRKAVDAFRRGVEQWYRQQDTEPQIHQQRLEELCSVYETVVEHLPVVQLPVVAELTTLPENPAAVARQASRVRDQARTREMLEDLSLRVQTAALRSLSASG